MLIVIAGCGGGQHPIEKLEFRSGWYEVQVPSGRLTARRPSGAPWHTRPEDNSAAIIGGLVGLVIGNPALGAIGEAMSSPGGDPLAPAPYVELKVEGETYSIAAVGRTYAPSWDQPIAIDARKRSGAERVILQVRDAVDNSVIGRAELSLADLLARPTQTMTQVGSGVASLDVVAKLMPPRQSASFDLVVPATMTLETLTAHGADGWRPIPVWNGDTITVDACGSVCATGNKCFGPDGENSGRWTSYNHDLVKAAAHVSLVAVHLGSGIAVGSSRTITVAQSGRMLFFVNDTDVENNSGAFAVHVTVTPPGEVVRHESRCLPAETMKPPLMSDGTRLRVTGIEPEKGDVDGSTTVRIKGNRFIADGPRMAKVYFGSR